jgi:hypothetical protein
MSLEKISAQLSSQKNGGKKKRLPVEKWDPPYCGEIDLIIKSNGDWFYNGTIFKRLSLVKLLASVLVYRDKIEGQGKDYFLVTPVEKIKITVEDVPFVLTQWQWEDDNKKTMRVSTNLGDDFILDADHRLTINDDGVLYVIVRDNLLARVHRNVYYQWVDLAEKQVGEAGVELVFSSAGQSFILGVIE